MPSQYILISSAYSGNTGTISAICSEWDIKDWEHSVTLLVNSLTNRNNLRNWVVPGAVDKLYTVLGTPYYYDTTWTSSNTLVLSAMGATLTNIRPSYTKLIIQSWSETPICYGGDVWYVIKLKGYVP